MYNVAERPLNESSRKLTIAVASPVVTDQKESRMSRSGAMSHFVISDDSTVHPPSLSF